MMRPARPPRLSDWPERLAALLADRNAAPFEWGRTDCAMLAADVVQALTGQDPAAELRGRYSDDAGAEALIADAGSLGALAACVLAGQDIPECPPPFAQRGDIALVEWQGVQGLGVFTAEGVMVLGPSGLHAMPLSAVQRAWAV